MDRTKEKVHAIVVKWMRRVLAEKGWSARQWASLAGVEATSITRIIHPPQGEEPHIPTVLNLFKLAASAGSAPDLLRGNRRVGSYVTLGGEPATTAEKKRKAG